MTPVFFTPEPGGGMGLATRKIIADMGAFTSGLGFVRRGARPDGWHSLGYNRLLRRSWREPSPLLAIYPNVASPFRHRDPLGALAIANLARLSRSAPPAPRLLLVGDMPLDWPTGPGRAGGPALVRAERRILGAFSHYLVVNEVMRDILVERHGFPPERFTCYDLLDYRSDVPLPEQPAPWDPRKVVVVRAGDCDPNVMGTAAKALSPAPGIHYRWYGPRSDWLAQLARPDFSVPGSLESEELMRVLAHEATFGLVSYGPQWGPYLRFSSTLKLSTYLCAGLPVLAPSDSGHVADLVRRHGVGLVVDSLATLPEEVASVRSSDYAAWRRNARNLSAKLRSGHQIRTALESALGPLPPASPAL